MGNPKCSVCGQWHLSTFQMGCMLGPPQLGKLKVEQKDPTIEKIIARIRERSDAGMEKYGQSLRDNNKKSFIEWIDDVQEEMYDAIAYLEKIKELLGGVK